MQTLDTQRYCWGDGGRTLVVENRTMTPSFPHGLSWRVERRCAYVSLTPSITLLTITAGKHAFPFSPLSLLFLSSFSPLSLLFLLSLCVPKP